MDQATRRFVRERAGERCEYCQRTQAESPMAKLQVEHILPVKHGGGDDLPNLGLACLACNLHKGPNLTGIDPHTGEVVELFHPRRQRWEEHGEVRQESREVGMTMKMNRIYAIGAPTAAGTQAFLPAGGSASAGFPAC